MQLAHKPVILIVLDGWGYTDNTVYNAIYSANKPVWEKLWVDYPHTLVSASGLDVGLPDEQMGNSEVGHMNIGAGRVVDQEFPRISKAIEDGSFYENEILRTAFAKAASHNKAAHFLGLLSPGGVHSHEDHIFSLMELAVQCGIEKFYLHAFLDGRDTPPRSAALSIHKAHLKMKELGRGDFASITGRFYAMDRNKNWDRTQQAYDLISQGKAEFRSVDPFIALDMAYARGETDEFVRATAITRAGKSPVSVEDGDVIVFANYRADRARQLARAFTKPDFEHFVRERIPQLGAFISLTEYKADYDFPVAFPHKKLSNVFGDYISRHGLSQLRIAETEKYAHVTFFFNGGEERVFEGEDRILIPSPHVATYDKAPEMSAYEITDKLIDSIDRRKYDAIICNFANADMVGHTGNFNATIKAIETIDKCLGMIIQATKKAGGEIIITSDHGNAEQMRSYTTEKIKSELHTAHTSNLVPLIYIGRPAEIMPGIGTLSDIAPTLLYLMDMQQPPEMTGYPLIKLLDVENRAIAGR
ncbi:MAG: phosphoglycerate mutase (2,3-diphosphoglycerate-independent) [Gammaproteobacteria bacterium RBG_16_51_14]|nr:MAG: phosphoglycerate mutase (2,3-diphosphoglycerate-independent) [Gammaproteobacteria bacterium RBG_16_51_14]